MGPRVTAAQTADLIPVWLCCAGTKQVMQGLLKREKVITKAVTVSLKYFPRELSMKKVARFA